MSGVVLVLLAAIGLRAIGSAFRGGAGALPARLLAWFLALSADILLAAAAGAFSPWLLPVAVVMAVGATIERLSRASTGAVPALADAAVVLVAARLSVPRLELLTAVVAAAGAAALGWILDRTVPRIPRRALVAAAAIAIAAGLAAAASNARGVYRALRPLTVDGLVRAAGRIATAGVCLPPPAERVELAAGAVAWLSRPAGPGPFAGALAFHGNDAAASAQPSACAMRRALIHGGLMTLAVDHPGYGSSPGPDLDAALDAWQPLASSDAALRWLRARPEVGAVIAVGHSMGCLEVLRLLAEPEPPAGGVLFGAGLNDPPKLDRYWYRRFHRDRRLSREIPESRFLEIRARFYDPARVAAALAVDHPPVLFARFAWDHAAIVDTRDRLYAMIPGAKSTWDLAAASHYFSTYGKLGVAVGDTAVARRVADRLRAFAEEVAR